MKSSKSFLYNLNSLISVGLVTSSFSCIADEGFYIETLNHSSGLTGDTPHEEISKTYLTDTQMRIVGADPQGNDMILDPTAGVMIFLNKGTKEYSQLKVKDILAGMSEPSMAHMRSLVENTKVSVVATGETKKIGDWNCKQYKVTRTGIMAIEQEVWTTEDVPIDVTKFTDMMSLAGPDGLLANSPAGAAQRAEMTKLKGYPILTKTKLQLMGSGMETENEVKVIRHETIPADLFVIPTGYSPRPIGNPAAGATTNAPAVSPEKQVEKTEQTKEKK